MEIKRLHLNRKKKIVGRGGKRGKTSGRGTKGQKARAGRKIRPALRDIIKKLPRRRGVTINKRGSMHTSVREKPVIVALSALQAFLSSETVTPETLLSKRIIKKVRGRVPKVKILDDGKLGLKVTINGCAISGGARKKIEAAGGTIA